METRDKRPAAPTKRRPVQPESRRQPAQKSAPPKKTAPAKSKTSGQTKKPTRYASDVVYTQPGPFNRNRFLLRLATVLAVVIALVMGMAIFFKVATVNVYGAQKYTAWEVMEASGIQTGDNLLGLSRAKHGSLIRSNLPYVESVRIGIKLPDTVNIEIRELEIAYAVQASDDSWWLMRADGLIVDKSDEANAVNHTRIQGVKMEDPQIGKQAKAWNGQPEETVEEGQTIPTTAQSSQQLEAALSVIQYLEENGLIGVAEYVNVEHPMDLEFWYGDQYRVLLGDTSRLAYKISSVKSAINQMGQFQTGTLDASFTVEIDGRKDQVIYTPFS